MLKGRKEKRISSSSVKLHSSDPSFPFELQHVFFIRFCLLILNLVHLPCTKLSHGTSCAGTHIENTNFQGFFTEL